MEPVVWKRYWIPGKGPTPPSTHAFERTRTVIRGQTQRCWTHDTQETKRERRCHRSVQNTERFQQSSQNGLVWHRGTRIDSTRHSIQHDGCRERWKNQKRTCTFTRTRKNRNQKPIVPLPYDTSLVWASWYSQKCDFHKRLQKRIRCVVLKTKTPDGVKRDRKNKRTNLNLKLRKIRNPADKETWKRHLP